MTDVLLIHPGCRRVIYQALGEGLSAVATPVWCGMLAQYAREHSDLTVEILDAEADDLTPEQIGHRVVEADPKLVAIVVYGHQPSASTQNMTMAGLVASSIKNHDVHVPVAMVGGHVSTLPTRTLTEEACDYVILGEGFQPLVQLGLAARAGRVDPAKIAGLAWREDGKVLRTAPPANVRSVPRVAYDLLDLKKYRSHNHQWPHALESRTPYASLYTSLGCPFTCSFCCIQAPFREGDPPGVNSYRFKPPEVALAEIDALVDRGVRIFRFDDEMFVLNRRHVLGICDALVQRSYASELNLWAYARIDTVHDRELLDRMRAAGFRWLCYGIESASERVRDGVDKGGYTAEDIARVVRQTEDAGIEVQANYIFGLPDDDSATMEETFQSAVVMNTPFPNFYVGMPYVGSKLYEDVVHEHPEWLPDSWAGYAQHAYTAKPLPTKTLAAPDVLRFRDDAFGRYFARPEYLRMITTKFGAPAVEEIRRMTAVKLKRKLLGDPP